MYSVLLDADGYFTGSYAEIGSIDGGVAVTKLPPDKAKFTCYRLDGGSWIFDNEKSERLEAETVILTAKDELEEVEAALLRLRDNEYLDEVSGVTAVKPFMMTLGLEPSEKEILIQRRLELLDTISRAEEV